MAVVVEVVVEVVVVAVPMWKITNSLFSTEGVSFYASTDWVHVNVKADTAYVILVWVGHE